MMKYLTRIDSSARLVQDVIPILDVEFDALHPRVTEREKKFRYVQSGIAAVYPPEPNPREYF